MKNNRIKILGMLLLFILITLSSCTSVNTFPNIARPGDTVSFMVGSSSQARKGNISAKLTDASGQVFDLQALGKVRSVFNLRTDGRAVGLHYSGYLNSYNSWAYGHEPLQTIMVTDLPATVAVGQATLSVAFNGVVDNSSGVGNPFTVQLEIIASTSTGASEQFLTPIILKGNQPVNFNLLETAPYAQVDFGAGSTLIGAVSLAISFNNAVVNANDLNVYTPEATVRGSFSTVGAFGKTQRMVYWHQDGSSLYVDIVAPQGVDPRYLKIFVVHPSGLIGSPAFSLVNAKVYGIDGAAIAVIPTLSYSP